MHAEVINCNQLNEIKLSTVHNHEKISLIAKYIFLFHGFDYFIKPFFFYNF